MNIKENSTHTQVQYCGGKQRGKLLLGQHFHTVNNLLIPLWCVQRYLFYSFNIPWPLNAKGTKKTKTWN